MHKSTKPLLGALAFGLLGILSTQAAWNVGYPWGRTHNGSAYMTHGGDVMTATQPGTNGYKYNSGASYSTVLTKVWADDPTMGAQATCIHSNPVRGVWPAFWMTTEGAWTGEIDIAEWKGNGTCWQNAVFKAHCWLINTAAGYNDVRVSVLINNVERAKHTGTNFRNKNFWIIRNLQMEGSSGSPGPTSASYTCKNISQW